MCINREGNLESNKLLLENQFGFCKYLSTEIATAYFTDQIQKAMDKGHYTGAVYIDLSKALDTISHSILIFLVKRILFLNMASQGRLRIGCAITCSQEHNRSRFEENCHLLNQYSVASLKGQYSDCSCLSCISTVQSKHYRNVKY